MKKDYTKLGGWLIFFIIVQILGSLVVLRDYSESTDTLTVLSTYLDTIAIANVCLTIGSILYVVGSGVGIVGVMIRSRKAINIHFIMQGLYLILIGIMSIILISATSGYGNDRVGSMFVFNIIRSVVVLVVWIQVFKNSPRAKVYFDAQMVVTTENEDETVVEVVE